MTRNDDIRQLRDAVRGTLGVSGTDASPAPADDWRAGWPAVAELGVVGLCVPEEAGGFGRRVDAAVATSAELGAALHGAPFAGLTASAHALARAAGTTSSLDDLLDGVLSGDRICAFGRLGPDGRTVRAVDGGPEADALLLLDPTAGDVLVLTDASAWTLDTTRYGFDVSRRCADIAVDIAQAHRLTDPGQAVELYGLLLAADAVGGLQRMLERTVGYAGQRQTFGKAIGGFQAVQHRLAEHTVRARGMALAVAEAARLLDTGSPDAGRAVAMAELSVSSGAVHIVHDLIQLTGAIGFTWEYGLHFYERRIHHDARLAANPRAAAQSLARFEGWTDAG
jgi:alkylation response protein AidB-like acyl-CoA dehydrogenase